MRRMMKMRRTMKTLMNRPSPLMDNPPEFPASYHHLGFEAAMAQQYVVAVVVSAGEFVALDRSELAGRSQLQSIPMGVRSAGALCNFLVEKSGIPPGATFSMLKSVELSPGLPPNNFWVLLDDQMQELPQEPVLYLKVEKRESVQLVTTPVRTSKKQKFSIFRGKSQRVELASLLGTDRQEVLVALKWLDLHLSGATDTLETFFSNPNPNPNPNPNDERRYYPYATAVVKAAALGTRLEILGQDGSANLQPDIQVICGDEVVPLDVKRGWSYGSVDDPDGIYRNAEVLEQLHRYVLAFNASKLASYSCVVAVIVEVAYVFFFKFYITKKGPGDPGTLARLDVAPGFWRAGGGRPATSILAPVELMKMDVLAEGRSSQSTFQEILPTHPPEGFYALDMFLRQIAGSLLTSPLVLEYEDKDGIVGLGDVLAYGPKSCVIAGADMATVVKVSSAEYMESDRRMHLWVDVADCPFLRKMVGHGTVKGAGQGMKFIELQGLGVPFVGKHVSGGDRLRKCWREASTALEALHGRRVYHRDMKPNNFIVLDSGKVSERLLLNDLDCGGFWDEQGSLLEDVGTPMFKSPLMVEGEEYGCRDDWLSLGLTFASLLGWLPRGVSSEVKMTILTSLAAHPAIPQEMKDKLTSALLHRDVCVCCSR